MTTKKKRHLKSFKKQIGRHCEVVVMSGFRSVKIIYQPLTGEKAQALSGALEAWKTTVEQAQNPLNHLWVKRLEQVDAIINLAVVFAYRRHPFASWQPGTFVHDMLSLPTREAIAGRIEKKVLAFWLLPTTQKLP